MFPVTVIDNFFPDPDKVVEMASNLKFYKTNEGQWPGERTQELSHLNQDFFLSTALKILGTFYESSVESIDMSMTFQKIKPFEESRNQGWIHRDNGMQLGGLIYLNQSPEPDTGTNIYEETRGYSLVDREVNETKIKHYLGHKVSDEEYESSYNKMRSQFTETIKVENRYNRLLLFDGMTYHGVNTFGKDTERLTLVFFLKSLFAPIQPLCR